MANDKPADKPADNGGTDERAELKTWFFGVLDEWLEKQTQTRTGQGQPEKKKSFFDALFTD